METQEIVIELGNVSGVTITTTADKGASRLKTASEALERYEQQARHHTCDGCGGECKCKKGQH